MTVYLPAHGHAAVLRDDAKDFFELSHPYFGAHIRSTANNDRKGWVQFPISPQFAGRKFKLDKVEVEYATGFKTIFDAIEVSMGGESKIFDKSDFGYSHDALNTVEFEVPTSPQIDKGISIALLFYIPGGDKVHGRWATIASVGAYLSPI